MNPSAYRPTSGTWVGFDTETQDGKAVLVCTGQAALPWPKGFVDIARWIFAQGDRFVAWNMDYDARAVLLYLPWKCLSQLHFTNWTKYRGWSIHYLQRKVFEITAPKMRGERERRTVRVFDVQQFFGGSLASAAPRVGMEKMDVPKSWYPRMGWALRHHADKVIAYCKNDAEIAAKHANLLLPRLMEFAKCDAPYSPAAVARSYFGSRLKFNETRWQQSIFEKSYRGGRIEVFQRGRCGAGVLYDIKSAYPYALSLALDPRKMTFARTEKYSKDAFYGAYHCRLKIPPGVHIGPVAYTAEPNREDATVYPTGDLELVLDRESVKLCRSIGLDPEISDGWEYLINEEVRLFPDIVPLFERRKKEPDLDLAIKLTLNGLYGILCQKIPTWIKPRWISERTRREGGEYRERFERIANTTHYAVGAFITAVTRRRVYELASLKPDSVLFIATDGIAFKGHGPKGVNVGTQLGDWSIASRFTDSLIVGAGVYSLKVDGEWKDKTRGFYAPGTKLVDLLDTPRYSVSVPATTVDTLAQSVKGGSVGLMNVVRTLRRELDFNFDSKRFWERRVTGRDLLKGSFTSKPWEVE